ncbi:MAG TPA: amidohydrolase family protein, partial [Pseudorhodoplanes sp.]|nr:amidohydrolase family protein [Pseudorhodoplanes sp.]
RAFPQTTIILDHVGFPLGIGPYADKRDQVFATWRNSLNELAKCENVVVKIGGMGMDVFGFGFEKRKTPASSEELAKAWKPFVDVCVEAFGVKRAMFESNFPVDKVSCSYKVLWNAFKRVAAGYSKDEKAALFHDTAARVYRLAQ